MRTQIGSPLAEMHAKIFMVILFLNLAGSELKLSHLIGNNTANHLRRRQYTQGITEETIRVVVDPPVDVSGFSPFIALRLIRRLGIHDMPCPNGRRGNKVSSLVPFDC